jgi:hypothetical protein
VQFRSFLTALDVRYDARDFGRLEFAVYLGLD